MFTAAALALIVLASLVCLVMTLLADATVDRATRLSGYATSIFGLFVAALVYVLTNDSPTY